jgi:hypothetical protein
LNAVRGRLAGVSASFIIESLRRFRLEESFWREPAAASERSLQCL